jgi:RHS repeat-associated protein
MSTRNTGQGENFALDEFEFPARQYSIQGRWVSPDPAGMAAVDPTNPQSWNRYAYVLNSPLSYIDPLGLDPGSNNCILNGAPSNCPWVPSGGGAGGGGIPIYTEEQCANGTGDFAQLFPCQVLTGYWSFGSNNSSTAPKESYADCIKKDGEYFSVQHGVQAITGGKYGNSPAANAFLGNAVSGLIGGVQSIGQGNYGGGAGNIGTAVGVEGIGHLEGAAGAVPNIALSYTQTATTTVITPALQYTATTSRTIAGAVPTGTLARLGASALAVAGTWKDAYDLSVATFSAVVCGIGR